MIQEFKNLKYNADSFSYELKYEISQNNSTYIKSTPNYDYYIELEIKFVDKNNNNITIVTQNNVKYNTTYYLTEEQKNLIDTIEFSGSYFKLLYTYYEYKDDTKQEIISSRINIDDYIYFSSLKLTAKVKIVGYEDETKFNSLKIKSTDLIRGVSQPTFSIKLSGAYDDKFPLASIRIYLSEYDGPFIKKIKDTTKTNISQLEKFVIDDHINFVSFSSTRDDRGNKFIGEDVYFTSYDGEFKTVQYYKPTINVEGDRVTLEGNQATIKATGQFYNGDNLSNYYGKVKIYTSEDGTNYTLLSTTEYTKDNLQSDNTFTITSTYTSQSSNFSEKKLYFYAETTDAFYDIDNNYGRTVANNVIAKAIPPLYVYEENDVNKVDVNGDLTIKGDLKLNGVFDNLNANLITVGQIKSKNLLYTPYTENNKLTDRAYWDDWGVFTDYYCTLEAGKTYTFSAETDGTWSGGSIGVECFLVKDKNYSAYYNLYDGTTFTPSVSGDYYLRYDVNKSGETHSFWNFQVEEGNIKTTYLPHQEFITNGKVNGELTVNGDFYSNIVDMFNDTSGNDWTEMMHNKIDYCIANMNTTKGNASFFINGGWAGVMYGYGIFSKIGNTYQLTWFSTYGIYYCIKMGDNYNYRHIDTTETYSQIYDNYSLGEQRIGTWINGKPIYRKVISHNITSSSQEREAHNISNFGDLINCVATIRNQYGYTMPISTQRLFEIFADSTYLYITSDWPTGTIYMSLEYTKTTD